MTTTYTERRVQNILAMLGMATADEYTAGVRWYEAAHKLAASLAHRYGYSVRTMAGVIAVISPQISWSRNVEVATLGASDGEVTGCLPRNAEKANRMLAGEDPDDVIRGPKVTNFFRNIITSGENDGVTIDRHAHSIAEGREYSVRDREAMLRVNGRRDGYGEYVEDYREAAYRTGLSAAKLQAIVWVVYRETLEGRVK